MIDEENIGDLKNQEDVNPTSQQDKIVNEKDEEAIPNTNGTGSNHPIPTSGSLVIKKDKDDEADEGAKPAE